MDKMSFDDLMDLYKNNRSEYMRYMESCSFEECMDYMNEAAKFVNLDLESSNLDLEETLKRMESDNFFSEFGDSIDNHLS